MARSLELLRQPRGIRRPAAVQGELGLRRGGLFGPASASGLVGDPRNLPVATSDFIFAAFGGRARIFGTTRSRRIRAPSSAQGYGAAMRARSSLPSSTAVGLTVLLGFQAFFIFAGVVRVLPLTGVTLPFVPTAGLARRQLHPSRLADADLHMKGTPQSNEARPQSIVPTDRRVVASCVEHRVGSRDRGTEATGEAPDSPIETRHGITRTPVGPDTTSSAS